MKSLHLTALFASFLAASACFADTPAFTTGASTPGNNPGAVGLVGFVFTLNENIDLTQLGFYVQSIGGGDTPHVALLNVSAGQSNPPTVIYDTGNLNNLTNYPSGLTDDAMNFFSVGTPILLTTGNTYEITAPIYFAEEFADTSTFSLGSAIQTASFDNIGSNPTSGNPQHWSGWDPDNGSMGQVYDYTAQGPAANYTAPSTLSGTNVIISTDFQYVPVSAVPEPQTLATVLGAVGALCSFRRIRRLIG
jgi:hypothetical protein